MFEDETTSITYGLAGVDRTHTETSEHETFICEEETADC